MITKKLERKMVNRNRIKAVPHRAVILSSLAFTISLFLFFNLVSSFNFNSDSFFNFKNDVQVVPSSGTGGDTINNYYNITNVNGSSYNSTYANFAYNQSSIFSYNHTSVCTAYTDSKVYNFTTATFNMYGSNWYNHSNIDNKKFWYNMTSTGSSVTFPNCGANEVLTNRSGGLTCVTDQTGGASATSAPNDLLMDLNNEHVMFEPFNPTLAIETGEVGQLGWGYAGTVTLSGSYRGNHPGTVKVSTSTGANSNNSLNLGSGADWIIDTTSGNITSIYLLNISHPPSMTENYTLYIGLHDAISTSEIPVDGIFWMVNTTQPNLTCVSSSNSARTYNVTTWQVNGSWLKLETRILNISGVYQQQFLINNVSVCNNGASNLPLLTTRAFGNGIVLRKYGGTTARTVDVDYWYYKQRFAISR